MIIGGLRKRDSMKEREKMAFWLNNLRLFALNSEVHCSREEKAFGQEHVGTRHVNLAMNGLIKEMHQDLGFEYENIVDEASVIEGGKSVLLFEIGRCGYYTDISKIHEVISYPTKNYHEFLVKESTMIKAIMNWYEGLIPVIRSHKLIGTKESEENYLLVYDIGKEIYAFTIEKFYPKYEIEVDDYGKDLNINEKAFRFIDFNTYERQLIDARLKIRLM